MQVCHELFECDGIVECNMSVVGSFDEMFEQVWL